MTFLKRFLAIIIATIIVVSTGVCSITVFANELENKVYGPQNKEGIGVSKKDIPDALVESGDFAEIIQDNYVKRLYNEEKDMNTIMFEKANGERTMYLFKKAVKYEDENGNIVDKDLSFKMYNDLYKSTLSDVYICDNGNNDIKIYMPEDISDGVKFVTDNKTIEMRAKGEGNTNKVTVNSDSVVYDEVFGKNTSLIYKPLLDGIKEEIVLDEYTGQIEYVFKIKLDGYKLVTLDDNCLYLENVDNGEIEGIIDSVYMIDANGVTDFNNYYTYRQVKKNEYEITAHVNEEFLEAETTEYPVVIDPTVTIQKSNSSAGIYDATLNSTSTTEGGSGSLFVGNRSNTENGISRVAMRFPGLNFTTLKVSVVISASVYLRDLICESSALTINCHQVINCTPGWTEANASWTNLSMTSNTGVGSLLSSQTISYSNGLNQATDHMYKFNITNAVFNWRKGDTTSMQRGIVFKAASESSVIHKTFGSYNRASYNPVFEMSYLPYNTGAYSEMTFNSLVNEANSIYGSNGIIYFNCLAMALVSPYWVGYDELGIYSTSDMRYLNTVGDKIVNYINAGNCSRIASAIKMGVGLSANYSFTGTNQYFIALKIMENSTNQCAFHVLAQTNTGTWVGKFGSQAVRTWGYINPDTNSQDCWKDPDTGKYYDSQTLYIRVTPK